MALQETDGNTDGVSDNDVSGDDEVAMSVTEEESQDYEVLQSLYSCCFIVHNTDRKQL